LGRAEGRQVQIDFRKNVFTLSFGSLGSSLQTERKITKLYSLFL